MKRQKNDVADAEAIVEAALRPTMRFVEPKTADQQARAVVFRTREQLLKQRTETINALRAHLYEFGHVAPEGIGHLPRLAEVVDDPKSDLPEELSQLSGALFHELIPFYIQNIDHTSYGQLDDRPFGTWDIWFNVINFEAENGVSERKLYGALYEEGPDWDNAGWRDIAAFSHCVLKPLEWSGLISVHDAREAGRSAHMIFKTPLWRSVLKLDTDDILVRAPRH